MDFIAKKIKQHINHDRDFYSFSNGIVTIKRVWYDEAITELINLNNVTKISTVKYMDQEYFMVSLTIP
jgi:hypothetical protein